MKGVCALAALLLFSPRCFRRPSYELFLRAHQGCAALAAYAIWRHITKRSTFPGICLYIAPGLFLLTTLAEGLVAVYRNFTLRRGYSRASVSKLRGAIRMRIDVPRSWSIRAGQYVNVWFPGVGFRAWLETHPFMIVSWTTNTEWSSSDSETATLMSWTAEKGNSFDPETATLGSRTVGKKGGPSGEKGSSFNPEGATLRSWAARKRPRSQLTTIQLLIDPRDGFTRRLLRHAETTRGTRKRLVLYSGPHGSPASMKEYGSVLMIASGFGIAAHLPYIKELLDGSQACQIVTRRIHLVWQLREQGKYASTACGMGPKHSR